MADYGGRKMIDKGRKGDDRGRRVEKGWRTVYDVGSKGDDGTKRDGR